MWYTQGAFQTARMVVHHDGLPGLWKGFGTVVGGMIPARVIYLYSLEYTKGAGSNLMDSLHVPETMAAGASSFVAGGLASLCSQLVVVPIDVISQRLMIQGGGAAAGAGGAAAAAAGSGAAATATGAAAGATHKVTAVQLVHQIVQREGLLGLYRGFWASAATFVPTSAIWWASYGAWQPVLWHQIDAARARRRRRRSSGATSPQQPLEQQPRGDGEVAAVQAVAGILTGCNTAVITNPMDVAKTRLQTAATRAGGAKPTWVGVVRELYATNGLRGFYRGVQPRMVSSSIWGTAMVSGYEFLKRICALPAKE